MPLRLLCSNLQRLRLDMYLTFRLAKQTEKVLVMKKLIVGIYGSCRGLFTEPSICVFLREIGLDILRVRDDMIYAEIRNVDTPRSKELDPDLPGLGQYYCLHCDRHFTNTTIRDEHYKTKKHRRRVKLMEGPAPHDQIDAEVAAGMGTPDNGPKLRVGDALGMAM